MKFVCYTSWHELPESAHELFEQGEKLSCFYSRAWLENVTASMDETQTLLLACVVSDQTVLAILPLIKSSAKTLCSLKHRYTTHYSFLLANENQQPILNCLAQGLSQLPFKGVLLEPVAADDPNIKNLQKSMEQAGYQCERIFRFYNWIYRLQEPSFEDYMANRPAWLRNTINRKTRKLERDHGYEIRLYKGTEVPQAMSEYHKVYTASWKANEQFVAFLDGVVADFSESGWSRLAVLYVDGQPIAAQLWFVLHAKANIFRLAYDEAWKSCSPGSILTRYLMEYVIDVDKVHEIDFLTGNEAYKQNWMAERRERLVLSCVKSVKSARWYESIFRSLAHLLRIR